MPSSRRRATLILLLLVVSGALLLSFALWMRGPLRSSLPAALGPRMLVFEVPAQVDEGPPPPSPSFDLLRPDRPTFHELLMAVHRAADDHAVEGIVLHIRNVEWGWARVHEMAGALREFRASGKPVYASLDGGGEAEYLLASAASLVSMPPISTLWIDGLTASATFYGTGLTRIGVRPNFARVGRYKSAVEAYTRDSLSVEAREELEVLVDDLYGLFVDSVAVARGLERASVVRLVDGGPYTGREALAKGLLDTLLSVAELDSLATGSQSEKHGRQSFAKYARSGTDGTGEHIALLVAEGEIVDGRSRDSGPFGGRTVGDETLVEALREIGEDDAIRAVVLRVDSPGGSGDASDAVWQELMRLRRTKPVVVSMGDLAAAGGYYLACAGDAIVAGPGTITGSIGVFGGKFNVLGLYHKLGLNVETVSRGRHAEILSPYSDFSPEELELFQRSLDQFYQVFLGRVAQGRDMTPAQVDSVAQGRVWSGRSAKDLGLVDATGGLMAALAIARERADLPADAELVLEVYPRPKRTFVQRWVGDLIDEGNDEEATRIPGWSELLQAYQSNARARGGAQAMLPYTLRVR
ncbi:MAG: signal peptide peptidase SppA [bacterium]